MLKYKLLHPEILAALGTAGHGARVLIADGNYPFATKSHPAARRVYLNLAPDLLRATDVLATLADAIPIEAAQVMVPESGDEPSIHSPRSTRRAGVGVEESSSNAARNRRLARCRRPRAVTVRQFRSVPISPGESPSHSASRSTSRSRGPRRHSASRTICGCQWLRAISVSGRSSRCKMTPIHYWCQSELPRTAQSRSLCRSARSSAL